MKNLTITGVGPGDPSLLTLAAVDAIKESTVVSYPVSLRGGAVSYTHLTLPTTPYV